MFFLVRNFFILETQILLFPVHRKPTTQKNIIAFSNTFFMVLNIKEKVESNFEGTIIDLETIGRFRNEYADSRTYSEIKTTIFGYINSQGLNILCAKSNDSITNLWAKVENLLPNLERPFYAFNSSFEMGVLIKKKRTCCLRITNSIL